MENSKEVDVWAKKSILELEKRGYLEKSKDFDNSIYLRIIGIIVIGVISIFSIIYITNHDTFKSDISQNVTCPQIPSCNCNFPQIPSCPTTYITCNNTCIFPNNMSIKLSNTTS